MLAMFELLKTYLGLRNTNSEKGQDLAEYALLLGFIAIVVVAGATILGTQISTFFKNLGGVIGGWAT